MLLQLDISNYVGLIKYLQIYDKRESLCIILQLLIKGSNSGKGLRPDKRQTVAWNNDKIDGLVQDCSNSIASVLELL